MTQKELAQKHPITIPLQELASYMGVARSTLARGIDDGKFPFGVNLGVEGYSNRYMIFTERWLAWMNGLDITGRK